MASKTKLGPRQQRFVDEYMVDLNATRAAVAAGYSKKAASQAGWEVLRNPKVAAEISRRQSRLAERLNVSSENVISELAKIAFSNAADFYRIGESGDLEFTLEALADPTKSAAVSQIDIIEKANGEKTTRIKLADKRAALADLSRHLSVAAAARGSGNDRASPPDPTNRELAMRVLFLLRNAEFIDSDGRPTPDFELDCIEQSPEAAFPDVRW